MCDSVRTSLIIFQDFTPSGDVTSFITGGPLRCVTEASFVMLQWPLVHLCFEDSV